MPRLRKTQKITPQRRMFLAHAGQRTRIKVRLRKMVKDCGGVRAFARAHDLDDKYVYKWYSAGVTPSTGHLLRFARISKVSPNWLLLGHGDQFLSSPKKAS